MKNVGSNSPFVSEDVIVEWRNMLLYISDDLDNNITNIKIASNEPASPTTLVVSDLNFTLDVLFVDFIFTSNCSVFITPEQTFVKRCGLALNTPIPESHSIESHHKFMGNICGKVVQNVRELMADSAGSILMRSAIFQDSLSGVCKPQCCSYPPLFGIINQLIDSGRVSQRISNVHDYILTAYLCLIQSTFRGQVDRRMERMLSSFNAYLGHICTEPDKMCAFLDTLSSETWHQLTLDYQEFKNKSLLQKMIEYFQHVEITDDIKSLAHTGLTWHSFMIPCHIPSVIANVYVSAMKSNLSDLVRRRMLEAFEHGLESKNTEMSEHYQSTFLALLQTLNVETSSQTELTPSETEFSLAYFDILNIADENKSLLFRVNIQIQFYSAYETPDSDEDGELEEGEEGIIKEYLDDITAAHVLFSEDFSYPGRAETSSDEHVSKRQRPNTVVVPKNVLLTADIMEPAPEDASARLKVQKKWVDLWTQINISIPQTAFQQSFMQALALPEACESASMLDHVLAEYSFLQGWKYPEFRGNLINDGPMIQRKGLSAGFMAHYTDNAPMCVAITSLEFQFLEFLSTEAVTKLGSLNIPQITLKKISQKKKMPGEQYSFMKWGSFPKDIVTLLYTCVASCDRETMMSYFHHFFARMASDSHTEKKFNHNPWEVLLVALMLLDTEKKNVIHAAVRFMFFDNAKLGQSDTPYISDRILTLPLTTQAMQEYFNDVEMVGAFALEKQNVLHEILKVRFTCNEYVFEFFKDYVCF